MFSGINPYCKRVSLRCFVTPTVTPTVTPNTNFTYFFTFAILLLQVF